jgi:nitroimidazol reductase NimA-like FMN-containing flavoprotein (pyridoxamine 5'-phosphate oxidase superfamily)
MVDDGEPYIVPLNFGYSDSTLYFHSAPEGRKIRLLRQVHKVCFEIDGEHELVRADSPCNWGMRYASIIGYGVPRFIEGAEEKRAALTIIMAQFSDEAFTFSDQAVAATAVFSVDITSMTGKRKP